MEKAKQKSTRRRKAGATEDSLSILGKNVRLLRGMRELTQEDLAELAGMKRGQLSQLERGHRGIQLRTLDRLAQALEVKAWELLRPRDDTGR